MTYGECGFMVLSNFFLIHQLVQPAYQSMLGHIRSRTLDNFKDAFENALKGGQGFAEAARDSTKLFMNLFDEESTGI